MSAGRESVTSGVTRIMSTDREQPTARPSRRRPGAHGPTIREVARAAGVGAMTVSRALAPGGVVNPETRARILAVADRLGYRPSRAARVLRGGRARVIGVMIPDLGLPLYGPWLRGAGDVARAHGYVLLVCDGQNSQGVIDQQLERLYAEQIDGLVIAGPLFGARRLQSFLDAGVPVVPETTPRARNAQRAADASERPALTAAFRRLVELGHRRIAYVAHVERDARILPLWQRLRIDTLRRTLGEVGAALDDELVLQADGPDECRTLVRGVLDRARRPSALVPGTEALTPAVLAALADAGLRVPEDASLIGFGDSLWEQAWRPPLSVVRMDYQAVARSALERLIARIEGAATVPSLRALEAEFVERGSCAPPAASSRRAR